MVGIFTGLIQDLGTVQSVELSAGGARLAISTRLGAELRAGDSVAVNGVCLTAVDPSRDGFGADVMGETLRRSSLGPLGPGHAVNLELPLRAGDRLGGHIVQGHVDGTGTVASVEEGGFARVLRIAVGGGLGRYVVEKGSIAVDGVSLTVAEVNESELAVSLVVETLARTTLGTAETGTIVNLEVDVLAKYVEKLAGTRVPQSEGPVPAV